MPTHVKPHTLYPRDGIPGAESDWETVTSERLLGYQRLELYQPHVEKGSSVADVSDTVSCDYYRAGYNPPAHFESVPENGIIRKASASFSRQCRLHAVIRRVSSSLDGFAPSRERAPQAFELKHLNGSFDSLNSAASSEYYMGGNHWQGFESSKDPQRVLFADRPATGVMSGGLAIPRLPFPLISLPEAAKLQRVRIERGEEDHTDPGSSFVTGGYSETLSTISSSTSPHTPRSLLFSQSQLRSSRDQIEKLSPVYSRRDSPRMQGILPNHLHPC